MIRISLAARLLGISAARARLLAANGRIVRARFKYGAWFTPDEPEIRPPKYRGRPRVRR